MAAVADWVPARAQRAIDIFTHPWRRNGVHPQVSATADRVFGGPGASRLAFDLDDIDVVLLAGVPAHRPFELAQAVSNGKHAFLASGPCAVDAAGCASLLHSAGAAERRGLVVGAALPWPDRRMDLGILAQVDGGDIGDIVAAEAASQRTPWRRFMAGAGPEMNWYYDEALSGGPMLTESLPLIDRMTSFFSGLPLSASGVEVRDGRNPGDIASHYSIQYRYADENILSVSSTLEPGVPMQRKARLVGTSGTFELAPANGPSSQRSSLTTFLASMAAPSGRQPWRHDIEQLVASTRLAILGREAARSGRTVQLAEIA